MSISSATYTLGLISKEGMPRWPGSLLHGAFFRRLRELDEYAARHAHNSQPRPFTISGLQREGGHLSFRLSGLSEPVSSVVGRAFEEGADLELGSARVRVLRVELESTDYEELYEAHVPGERTWERISLRFSSPVTFRVGKANMPMPLPRLLWQSWATRWNAFSAVQLGNFWEWAEENIAPARFRLRSQVARVGGATLVGALGECEYRILSPASVEARVAAMLSAYSRYCGSGQKTTMGLGATEPLTTWPGRST